MQAIFIYFNYLLIQGAGKTSLIKKFVKGANQGTAESFSIY